MQIHKIQNNVYNSCKMFPKRVTQNAKKTLNQLEKKNALVATPLKYYLIGLALPIPFASTVGLFWGLGIAVKQKIKDYINKDKSS